MPRKGKEKVFVLPTCHYAITAPAASAAYHLRGLTPMCGTAWLAVWRFLHLALPLPTPCPNPPLQ